MSDELDHRIAHAKDPDTSGAGADAAAAQKDRARIDAYLAGGAPAFEELDKWIRGELRRRYPGLEDEHEDLCQTVHGKLFVNLKAGRYEGRSRLRTYVTGIAHRTVIDRLRELYRVRALTDELSREPTRDWKDPYAALEAMDENRLLHQALLTMPPACRELWRLVFVEKLGYEDVGKQLSIPAGTVKSRMWHCRRKAMAALRRLRRLHRP